MAAPEPSGTNEQSSGASQNSPNTNSSNLARNDKHRNLDPRATSFTPRAPINTSPTYRSPGNERGTAQLAIPSTTGGLQSDGEENCVLRASVQEDTKLASSATNLSEKEHPIRQPTVPPTPEDLEKGLKMNFVWQPKTR